MARSSVATDQSGTSSSMSPPLEFFGFGGGGFFSTGGEIGFTMTVSCISPLYSTSPRLSSISLLIQSSDSTP